MHAPAFLFQFVTRIYNRLPEVTKKKEEEKKRAESQTNRLRVEAFKKVNMQCVSHPNPSSKQGGFEIILKCGLGADVGLLSFIL